MKIPQLTALALVLLHAPAGASAQTPVGDAYLDAGAAAMVAGARAGGEEANASIDAYEMVAKQRFSVGLEAQRRDRVLFRREIASKVSWTRENGRQSEIMGARQAVPIAIPGVLPIEIDEYEGGAADLAIDPTGGWLLSIPGLQGAPDPEPQTADSAGVESGDSTSLTIGTSNGIIHPLQDGSEEHYRFRSGGTTTIRLPDGRNITLLELQVLPRRADPRLLSGSFWLDADTHSLVRGVFSLAAPATMDLDANLGFVSIGFGIGSATIRYLTVEYGYWESRWWLPRLVAFEGLATMAGVSVPLLFEQAYEDYRIYSSENPWPGFAEPDTTRFMVVEQRCRRGDRDEDRDARRNRGADRGGANADADADDDPTASADTPGRGAEEDAERCPPRTVLVPLDSAQVINSPELPPSIYSRGNWLAGERELNEVAELLGASRWRGFFDRAPRLYWHPIDAGLFHYNRVEGLSVGTKAGIDVEPLSASAALWVGLTDRSPSFSVDLERRRLGGVESVSAYRRVEAFSPVDDPFSLGNSLSAFLFGRDNGDYFRVLGASATSEHDLADPLSATLRGYVERHTAVEKTTDVSVPHWTNDRLFRENPPADAADQLGGELTLEYRFGFDPTGFRLGANLGVRGETGTFQFAMPSGSVFTTFPLPGSLVGALELAGGTSTGDVPVQRLWYIGGPGSVRGIRPDDRAVGNSFWWGRAEMGSNRPGARLVVFGDAGFAGDRDDFDLDPTLLSAGVGASFLDGLIRADVAKALRGGTGWSFHVHLDAPL